MTKTIEINLTQYFKSNDSLRIEDYIEKYDRVIISGDHCRVIIEEKHPIREFRPREFRITTEYQTVGSNKPTDSEKQKAAHFISNLPSNDLTEGKSSLNLDIRWMNLKDDAIRIAKCFLWGRDRDFLADELQKGIIDKYKYDYIWLLSDRYEILWKLLYDHQDAFEYFLPQYPNYYFTSLREVFEEIVRSSCDGQLNLSLKKRYVYKPHEIKIIFVLKQKIATGNKLTKKENKKLERLGKNHFPENKWETLVVSLATDLYALQPLKSIREFFEKKSSIEKALHRLEIEKYCNPKYKEHVVPSHTWEKGNQFFEIKKNWQT